MFDVKVVKLCFIFIIVHFTVGEENTLFPCLDEGQQRNSRVVGGVAANPGDAPYMVSLTRRGGHFCGAVVITQSWLLTAGHCICNGINLILKSNQIQCVLGQHNISDLETNKTGTHAFQVSVLQIVPHPEYFCGGSSNDVALLQLVKPIDFDAFVRPVCISLTDTVYSSDDDDPTGLQWGTVAGWGWTNEDHSIGERADTLQKAQLIIWSSKRCRKMFGQTVLITDRQLCAGRFGGGIDSCWADSGGPLLSKTNRLIGIVSTGIGCGRPGLPGIYTKVFKYIDWIRQTTSTSEYDSRQ